MAEVVLDASALLAWALWEPGRDAVAPLLQGARVSAVNLAEVVNRLIDRGFEDEPILALLDDLPCEIEPLGPAEARRIGFMRRATRRAGLSLGDRACLDLAAQHGLPALTADRAWAELDLGVEVVLIR